MNSKFGTALALSAVLATGTAAAAINTQALVAPTKSSLGTAGTTLLPVDQVASVTTGQTQNLPTTTSTAGSSQGQTTNTPAPGQSAGSMPDVTTPAATQPTSTSPTSTSPTSTSLSPSSEPTVIYGNPNPSTGGDDIENDNEGKSNDSQGNDGQSKNGQSNDGDDD
jgi:hypothetical protein